MSVIPTPAEDRNAESDALCRYRQLEARFLAVELKLEELKAKVSHQAYRLVFDLQLLTNGLVQQIESLEGTDGHEITFRQRLYELLEKIALNTPQVLKKVTDLRADVLVFKAYQNPGVDFEECERSFIDLRKKIVKFAQYFERTRREDVGQLYRQLVAELDEIWEEKVVEAEKNIEG